MQIKPVNNCLMVELSSHQKSSSGLELPVKEEDKSLRAGKVMAIPGEEISFNGVTIGDTVIFGEYAFDKLQLDGQYFVFVDFQDIIGIIK